MSNTLLSVVSAKTTIFFTNAAELADLCPTTKTNLFPTFLRLLADKQSILTITCSTTKGIGPMLSIQNLWKSEVAVVLWSKSINPTMVNGETYTLVYSH